MLCMSSIIGINHCRISLIVYKSPQATSSKHPIETHNTTVIKPPRCLLFIELAESAKLCYTFACSATSKHIVSAHRRILGMASVVCVLVKICVSSILLYKLDADKLTAPFESAHQFTLVCTVLDSKTVPGCHYNLCSNHSFLLTD